MTNDDLLTLPIGTALTTLAIADFPNGLSIDRAARLLVVANDAMMPQGTIVLRLHPADQRAVASGRLPIAGHSIRLPAKEGVVAVYPFKTTPYAFTASEAVAAVISHRLVDALGSNATRAAGRIEDNGSNRRMNAIVEESMALIDVPAKLASTVRDEAVHLANTVFVDPPDDL